MRAVARTTSFLQTSVPRPLLSTFRRTATTTPRLVSSDRKVNTRKHGLVTLQRHQIAKMSTESTQSQACCNTPAVVSKGYSPKGDYIEVDSLKTCTEEVLSAVRYGL
jgi:hypothetical protein